jgi:hypothetical protein
VVTSGDVVRMVFLSFYGLARSLPRADHPDEGTNCKNSQPKYPQMKKTHMKQHATHSAKGLVSTGTCRDVWFLFFFSVRDKVPLSVQGNHNLLEKRFLQLVTGAVYTGRKRQRELSQFAGGHRVMITTFYQGRIASPLNTAAMIHFRNGHHLYQARRD